MKALTFTIHLLEPVLVMDAEAGDPNGIASLNYLPGSVVRGGVVNLFRAGNTPEAADPLFRKLFLDGEVRYLNAYPLSPQGQRALPTPFSWHSFKDEDDNVLYDFLFDVNAKDKTRKPASQPFCHLHLDEGKGKAELIAPEYQLTIHTARDDRQNMSTTGAVFRYTALAAEQDFGAVIVATDDALLTQIYELMKKHLHWHVGKSRTAGYGRVAIQVVKIEDDWHEYQAVGDDEHEQLTVTLLSDMLLRDPDSGADTVNLSGVLRLPLESKFTRTHLVGGFNRKWNLPTPQARAVQAGSVYTAPPEAESRLRELEKTGLGERRVEGFGRIAVNWHRLEQITVAERHSKNNSSVLLKEVPATQMELAKRMVERMARAELDKRLTASVVGLRVELHGLHSSQISRIRLAAREMIRQNKGKPLSDQFDEKRGMKKNARDQFAKARVQGKTLEVWLKELANNPALVWGLMNGVQPNDLPQIGANVRAELTPQLAIEYAARLIDGTLRQAQRKEKRNG